MKSTLKHTILTLLVGMVTTGAMIWVGYSWGKTKQYSKDLTIQTTYEYQLDSLKQVLNGISKLTVDYSSKCDSLELELKALSKKSEKLKEEYDKKINSVTHYTNVELQRFFTERYSN